MSRTLVITIGLSLIAMGILWMTNIPLGIPGEWTWERIEFENAPEFVFGAVLAAIFGALVILVAWLGIRRIANATKLETAGWLTALMGTSFAWLMAVQESPADGYRLNKVAWVLYYPGASGYFHQARYKISDTQSFLENYESLMEGGDVLHVGTHPPGLFLFYRGLIKTVDSNPWLQSFAEWTMTQSAIDGFDTIEANNRGSVPFTRSDRATIWLAYMISQASSVVSIIPIYLLARSVDKATAWKCVCFWPFVPAVAVFLPKSDVFFTGISIWLVCTWLVAAQRNSLAIGAIAGIMGFLGLLFSLAFLPVGLIAILTSTVCGFKAVQAAEVQATEREPTLGLAQRLVQSLRNQRWALIAGLAGFVLSACLVALWKLNILKIWSLNYSNHAGFYEQFDRTSWKWLIANPIELIFAMGVPLFLLVCVSIFHGRANRLVPLVIGSTFVWILLWISGKNSGEAARLWVPLMPIFTVIAAPALTESKRTSSSRVLWLPLLVTQAIVALLTTSRVCGFHFG